MVLSGKLNDIPFVRSAAVVGDFVFGFGQPVPKESSAVTPATLIAAATSAGVPPATVDAVAVKLLLSPAFLHHGVPSDPLRVLLRGPDLPAGPLSAATFNAVKRALQNVRPHCFPLHVVPARIPRVRAVYDTSSTLV